MAGYDWITLTTDYGLSDGFVAACHGVIARLAPRVRIIDVTHLVPAGDVSRGSAVLAQTVPHLPVAVHVAVVDPGVGTGRRGVAIPTADGGVLIGPDNGVLLAAVDALGGPTGAVELTNPGWRAGPVSATFHGRDVFAPAAARIATGADVTRAGPAIDPASLVRLPEPVVILAEGIIEAEVVGIDRFGNVQLAAASPALDDLGDAVMVGRLAATRGRTFGDAPPGGLVVYPDSAGKVALAINGGRAALALGVSPGDIVRITDARVG